MLWSNALKTEELLLHESVTVCGVVSVLAIIQTRHSTVASAASGGSVAKLLLRSDRSFIYRFLSGFKNTSRS